MPKLFRVPAVVLLALIAGSAYALPARQAAPEPAGLFAPLWNWLSGFFAPGVASALQPAWQNEGSQMDPDGVAAPPPGDEGSQMDPNGLASTPRGDEGSQMDPDG
jgi:hypothetical protein